MIYIDSTLRATLLETQTTFLWKPATFNKNCQYLRSLSKLKILTQCYLAPLPPRPPISLGFFLLPSRLAESCSQMKQNVGRSCKRNPPAPSPAHPSPLCCQWTMMPPLHSPVKKIWQSLSSFCLYLYCSALLEQLNQLHALLSSSSGKTSHRGTCILVRWIP